MRNFIIEKSVINKNKTAARTLFFLIKTYYIFKNVNLEYLYLEGHKKDNFYFLMFCLNL